MKGKSFSLIGFLLLVASILALIKNQSLIAETQIPRILQGLSILLMVIARLKFGRRSFHPSADPTEGGLITNGPYKFIRHPIYASVFYFVSIGVLTHISFINIIFGIGAVAGIAIRIYLEEKLIIEKYPEYLEYSQKTKRIIPYII